MSTDTERRSAATLADLERLDLFRLLQRSQQSGREAAPQPASPEALLSTQLADEICEIYEALFRSEFSRTSLAALEHSNYVFYLWPLLTLDSLPLVPCLAGKARDRFQRVRYSAVMTCVWAAVEDHSSGRSEYADLLREIVREHPRSMECVFYNAAQLMMLESWQADLCDRRDANDWTRVTILEQRALLRFLILCFQRFEVAGIRRCCIQLVSPATWLHIPPAVRERNVYAHNRVAKTLFARSVKMLDDRYGSLEKVKGLPDFSALDGVAALYGLTAKAPAAQTAVNERARFLLNRDFLNSILNHFVYILEDGIDLEAFSSIDEEAQGRAMQRLMLCENHLEFIVDLLSQLNTRRIVKPLFDAKLILVRCRQTPLHEHLEGSLFKSMLDILNFYMRFYIDEELGTPLDYDKVMEQYYDRFESFQRVCFTKFKSDAVLKSAHLLSAFDVQKPGALATLLAPCKSSVLGKLTMELGLFAVDSDAGDTPRLMLPAPVNLSPIKEKGKKAVKNFLIGVISAHLERSVDSVSFLNGLALYPTEELLWSSSQLPSGSEYVRLSSLALHKLNLQYLTLFDYLYRNFSLLRLESSYQIKSDLESAIDACAPRAHLNRQTKKIGQGDSTETRFEGSHPMAIEVSSVEIRQVSAATVLRSDSSYVEADIVIDTARVKEFQVRKDWQRLKRHDVVFLVAVSAPLNHVQKRLDEYESSEEFPLNLGVNLVRGAEISQVLDEEGHVISDLNPYETRTPIGFRLVLKVMFDYNQYISDIERDPNIYGSMNLLVRRHSKVNNFKAVLSTLRNMINRPTTLPSWLSDVFLGFGDPQQCQYPHLEPEEWHLNFLDTWKNVQHFCETAHGFLVKVAVVSGGQASDWQTREIDEAELFVKAVAKDAVAALDAESLASMVATECDHWPGPGPLGVKLKGRSVKKLGGNRFQFPFAGGFMVVQVDELMLAQLREKGVMLHGQRGTLRVPPKVALLRPRFKVPSASKPDAVARPNIEFTPAQVESIRSGVSPGITLVVGPPGTGKTDCVCQIVGILFKSIPGERTVICTHSNFALNDIFTKLVLNGHVDEHHIVRLGGSEFEIEGLGDFSKWGRVNFILQRRLDLLEVVKKLVDTLDVRGDYNFSIQLALSFFEAKVSPLIRGGSAGAGTNGDVDMDAPKSNGVHGTPMATDAASAGDPQRAEADERVLSVGRRSALLTTFFDLEMEFPPSLRDLARRWDLIQGLKASGKGDESGGEAAALSADKREFLVYLNGALKELQPFEVLRNNSDRGRYLVEKYARLVAMTCTHAAIAKETMETLRYANLVMEEAAQVLEVETFSPLAHPLKRVILSGDHYQLPPVVNNRSLLKFANMQQSLFHRLVRLETPHVMLNRQGRCRPEIAGLFTHFYPIAIENIELALGRPEFGAPNRGFEHTFQFVDCGGAESAPIAHYYQNLEEAEFVVATYMYMRLSGYAAESIVILCAYNGQKALVEDIVKHKCAWNPRIKSPRAIATVDKFQGRQSDFVLLSLVRSERPGHLRDPRRMLVALSRARLGIYIFGNWSVFSGCRQLMPFAARLEHLPRELRLFPGDKRRKPVSVRCSKDMFAIVDGLQ